MKENDYIAFISDRDFDNLYRFGRIQIDDKRRVLASLDLEDIRGDRNLFRQLTDGVCDFQLPFEYLFVHYKDDGLSSVIYIQNVYGFFPLTSQAKNKLSNRFDSIVFNEPLWPKEAEALIRDRMVESCKRGIDNICILFNISKEEKDRCSKVIRDDIIKSMVDNVLSGKDLQGLPIGEKDSLWLYLMRYQRTSPFPQDDSGFMLDASYVFFLYRNRGDVGKADNDIERSGMCKALIGQKTSFPELWKYVDEKHDGFKTSTDNEAVGYSKVAPIFCILMRAFGNGVYDPEKIVSQKCTTPVLYEELEEYREYFNLALYVFGAVMGYEKTYDALYHQQSLAIFRKDEVWPFRGENSSQSQKNEQNQEPPSKNDTQGYSGEPQAKTLEKQGAQDVQPQEDGNVSTKGPSSPIDTKKTETKAPDELSSRPPSNEIMPEGQDVQPQEGENGDAKETPKVGARQDKAKGDSNSSTKGKRGRRSNNGSEKQKKAAGG